MRLNLYSDGSVLARHRQTGSVLNSWPGVVCSNPTHFATEVADGKLRFKILFGHAMSLQIQFWKLAMEGYMYVFSVYNIINVECGWNLKVMIYNNQLTHL